MQSIQIIFAPDLAVSPADFVQAWNTAAPSRDLPPAAVITTKSPPEAFPLDPQIQQWLIYLAGAATPFVLEIVKGAVQDVVKELLTHAAQRALPAPAPMIKVETITQPDGAVLLVVHGG